MRDPGFAVPDPGAGSGRGIRHTARASSPPARAHTRGRRTRRRSSRRATLERNPAARVRDNRSVFYFFRRQQDTVTCEMRPSASGSGYDIVIMEPGKPVAVETFRSPDEVHARWKQVQEQFKGEGWWGPTASH